MDTQKTINATEVKVKSGLLALIIRSGILAGISSPITVGNYWEGVISQAILGIIICLILYGLELAIFRTHKGEKTNPYVVAIIRATVLLFVLSLLKFGDLPRAFGSMISGALFGGILFLIETGCRKIIKKIRARRAQ
jgi:uncharacterized membrane protein YeaQ/YmgE (transglycosylase-associated protein family)